MGVQGTKESAEALHEIFMGIFLFLASSFPRHRSGKLPGQEFWVQEAGRSGLASLSLTSRGRERWSSSSPVPILFFSF